MRSFNWPIWRLKVATLGTGFGDALLVGGMTFEAAGFRAAGLSIASVLMAQAVGATIAATLGKRLLADPSSRTVLTWASVAAVLNLGVLLFPLRNLITLSVLSLSDAFFSVFLYSASSALVARLASDDNKSRFMASFQNLRTAGSLIGVPVGVFLVSRGGLWIIFVGNACSYLVYAIAWYVSRSMFAGRVGLGASQSPSNGTAHTTRGIPWTPILTICGCIVLTVSIDTAGLVLVRERLGSLDRYTGLILLLWPLGGILANRIPAAKTLRGDVLALYGASCAMGLALGLMPALPFSTWIAFCYAVGGVCMGLQNRSVTAVILKLSPPASLAASFAKFAAMANSASFAGYALSGVLIIASPSATLRICGSGILAISVGGYFYGRITKTDAEDKHSASSSRLAHAAISTTNSESSAGS